MAHTLKLEVVAEGVETAAQLHWLRNHDCDEIQGYLFSRPLPAAQIEVMLRQRNSEEESPVSFAQGGGASPIS
jgi:EAL domain-containing protein (putative c-di-GMP-specific phosphodiesterase class I)